VWRHVLQHRQVTEDPVEPKPRCRANSSPTDLIALSIDDEMLPQAMLRASFSSRGG
jgi:hypothetical protein